jgi:hypothetical protein
MGDHLFRNHPRATWHLGDKTQRRCAGINHHASFIETADAADFYAWFTYGVHGLSLYGESAFGSAARTTLYPN